MTPFGFTRMPSFNTMKRRDKIRSWLIGRLAGNWSIMINCSTGDFTTVIIDGSINPIMFHTNMIGVSPLRKTLRKGVHIEMTPFGGDGSDDSEPVEPEPHLVKDGL